MDRGRLLSALALAAACNGDGAPSDGPFTIDIDNGACGELINFTGELVDWDSDTSFCGVFNARFQIQDDGAMDVTAPNGRFELCVPDRAVTLLDVTPPAADSPCASPPSPYPLAGIAVANRDVIRAGAFFSVRSFTAARRDSFFAQAGFSFAPALAQVFVHVHGSPRPVSLDASHAPAQANVGGAWMAGDTGANVFFPNVDPSAGEAMLSVDRGAIGTGMIPLAAGRFTYVTVYPR